MFALPTALPERNVVQNMLSMKVIVLGSGKKQGGKRYFLISATGLLKRTTGHGLRLPAEIAAGRRGFPAGNEIGDL